MIKTTLKIDGMMCGMCESHINDAIRNSFDVKKVNSSHTKGETVIVSKEALDEDKIKSVIDKTGYELKSISSEEFEEKKGLFGFLKK
ncbi:MAG: heavy metal-associated domain-containing protein [Acutalibacteraceae bacterium]|jgi:copper chaperone CopZ|nr:heavy metal-associated domain-containing protein [Acutalibacteraceae bacterium]